MSEVLGAATLTPADFAASKKENGVIPPHFASWASLSSIRRIPLTDAEIVTLPDTRAARVLSRTALIIYRVASSVAPSLSCLQRENGSFRVGLYCANELGPMDYASMREISEADPPLLTGILRRKLPPKYIFKYGSNVPGAQTAIFLGIQGPLCTFMHGRNGVFHALEQAEFDLAERAIDQALVCSAFSLEDPLADLRIRRSLDEQTVLSEGGAAVILSRGETTTHWEEVLSFEKSTDEIPIGFYGIADPLIRLAARFQPRRSK